MLAIGGAIVKESIVGTLDRKVGGSGGMSGAGLTSTKAGGRESSGIGMCIGFARMVGGSEMVEKTGAFCCIN